MAANVQEERAADKDIWGGLVVPSGRLLSTCIQARRPVYRPAPGVGAPRLELVPGPGFSVVPAELDAYNRAPEAVLRPRVVAWLERPEAQPSRQHALDSHDLRQLKALTAAALADIAGLRQAAVSEWITPPRGTHIRPERRRELLGGADGGWMDAAESRFVTRKVSEGRGLWVALAAWPWWAVVDAGHDLPSAMRAAWWTIPRVRETFVHWAGLSAS